MLQVFLSRVDQRLHGEILPADAQTAQAIAEIEMELAVFPFAASGAPVHARYTQKLYLVVCWQAGLEPSASYVILLADLPQLLTSNLLCTGKCISVSCSCWWRFTDIKLMAQVSSFGRLFVPVLLISLCAVPCSINMARVLCSGSFQPGCRYVPICQSTWTP